MIFPAFSMAKPPCSAATPSWLWGIIISFVRDFNWPSLMVGGATIVASGEKILACSPSMFRGCCLHVRNTHIISYKYIYYTYIHKHKSSQILRDTQTCEDNVTPQDIKICIHRPVNLQAGNSCIVPRVHKDLCGTHVFVMEFIQGGPILDLGKARYAGDGDCQ